MPSENSSVLTMLIFTAIVLVGIFCILKLTKDKTRKVSTLRLFVQIVAVVAVFMGLILGPFETLMWQPLGIAPRDRLIGKNFFGLQFPDGLSVPIYACFYASGRTVTCPIWQIQAYVFPFWNYSRGYEVWYSTSGLEKLAIVFGLVIVMSLVLGRFFCGWLCPFGLYMDLITRIRKIFGRRHLSFSEKTNTALGQLRYVIIAIFLVLCTCMHACMGTPNVSGAEPSEARGRRFPFFRCLDYWRKGKSFANCRLNLKSFLAQF